MMHMQGLPATMQDSPRYDDVLGEITAYLSERIDAACAAGIQREAIMIDPGIGFGKSLEQNLLLIQSVEQLQTTLQRPLLMGLSRKSFLPLFMGRELPAAQRDAWSHYFHAALAESCAVLRVHDVQGCVDAMRVRALFANNTVLEGHQL